MWDADQIHLLLPNEMAQMLERAKRFKPPTLTLARLFDRNLVLQNLRFFKRKSIFLFTNYCVATAQKSLLISLD